MEDETKVEDEFLTRSGSKGIIRKGNGIQIIYGPQVSIIKSNFEEYVQDCAQRGIEFEEIEESGAEPEKKRRQRYTVMGKWWLRPMEM